MSTDRRPIPGHEDRYEIDRDGNVYATFAFKRLQVGRMMKHQTSKDGYAYVVLATGGSKSVTGYIHRLLMLTFYPVEGSDMLEVNHIDLIKSNNRLDNLEWMTHQNNIIHAHKMDAWGDRQERGEQINSAKLTEADVRQIRAAHEAGITRRELAQQFGVTRENIGFIVLRKTWAHVQP